jgi:2-oxo-hept-3-ene-1,7-dioate hydratase
VKRLAGALDEAERTRTQLAHFSLKHREMTIDDGYVVQRAWVDMKLRAGRRMVGHKIGLTSRTMQQASNIREPDYGVLLDDMVIRASEDLDANRFIVPRVEVELAFILRNELRGPHCTIFDVLKATDYVVPAVEIIDARIRQVDPETGRTRTVVETISDNAANAGIILGGRPVRVDATDLRWGAALLYKNGVVEESGVAAAVLNHPANGIAWLANKLAAHDVALQSGQIVLAGSFTRPVYAHAGDTFHVDYGPLGAIAWRFT